MDMILSDCLFVASFKTKGDREQIERMLNMLNANYREFEVEESEFKYRLDIFV